ncbi:uncharacterized protein J3D65DRAFT_666759 [Phyllosticta citribraziliensis]|uniref:Uncharacterized protein n=1 Tax=Phyllosticta citribraziliensis TaxID=989973 RepID=A0ABR1LSA0_9PEZI
MLIDFPHQQFPVLMSCVDFDEARPPLYSLEAYRSRTPIKIKTTAAQTAKKPANKNAVYQGYELKDGDDQMWHAKWCLGSWNKSGSNTLLLFEEAGEEERRLLRLRV